MTKIIRWSISALLFAAWAAAAQGPPQLAAPQPVSLRRILTRRANGFGRKPLLVPVPWQAIWLGLRTLEMLGLRALRSDSVLGFVHSDPAPQFDALSRDFRPFDDTSV